MFTLAEFQTLCRTDVRESIAANIGRNPVSIALDSHIAEASTVATQVKRLQRASRKLPSFRAALAILPPRAYEQSSSEACAARKGLSGVSVLDLTCGLGVDALALSRRFERVVAVERDEVLAMTARENFARLGVTNIAVVCASAEEYLRSTTEHFDWCFVDPDRRDENGARKVRLEECSPDVTALRSRIGEVAERLCIKCSPLFDVGEAFRLFGDCRVESVSIGGECKEVNIYIDGSMRSIAAVAIGSDGSERLFEAPAPVQSEWCGEVRDVAEYRYLTLPDAALQHSRLVAACFAGKADVWSDNSVALSVAEPSVTLGCTFAVREVLPFNEKALRKRLKGRRVEIMQRDFPLSNAAICSRLGVREGGTERWCFARVGGRCFAFGLEDAGAKGAESTE